MQLPRIRQSLKLSHTFLLAFFVNVDPGTENLRAFPVFLFHNSSGTCKRKSNKGQPFQDKTGFRKATATPYVINSCRACVQLFANKVIKQVFLLFRVSGFAQGHDSDFSRLRFIL